MRTVNRQAGMTAIGWLIVLAIIGFFVLITLKTVPAYLDYYKVVSTLESLEAETDLRTPHDIRRLIQNRFDISYVDRITAKDLKIVPAGPAYKVTAQYNVSEHLFGNVYVVMKFYKQVKVAAR
ncbi:MAG: DUF4845 domain-containing protein [Gammaproteobacteria bacterium]